MVYSPYEFATPLANGVKSFGMWLPNTDPSGSGLILPARYRGQEGAAADAPMHSHLGVLGVTGFLMKDLNANPLDYVEGGPLNQRRVELSAILDSTNPDLSAFHNRGGKLIVAIGTNDTLASPGAQVDYYQSVIDKMGAGEGRCVRPLLRHSAGGPRPDGALLHYGWGRERGPVTADSEHLRSLRNHYGLGGKQKSSSQVGDGHRGGAHDAAVFLSGISEVC